MAVQHPRTGAPNHRCRCSPTLGIWTEVGGVVRRRASILLMDYQSNSVLSPPQGEPKSSAGRKAGDVLKGGPSDQLPHGAGDADCAGRECTVFSPPTPGRAAREEEGHPLLRQLPERLFPVQRLLHTVMPP